MKKLHFIINSLQIGGAECHLSYLLPLLITKGWEIKLISLSEEVEGDLTPILKQAGIKVCSMPKISFLNKLVKPLRSFIKIIINLLRLSAYMLKDRHVITHFFLPESYILGAISAKLTLYPAPLVMSRRSLNYYQKKNIFLKKLECFLHKHMAVILGNSRRVLKQLYFEEEVPIEKLGLIYNGITLSQPHKKKSILRSELLIDEDAFVMVVVANIIPYKGHQDLLTALTEIKSELSPRWRLLVIGRDTGIKKDLISYAETNNISNHIKWLGARTDVIDILSISNLSLLTSHTEGFSNAILESMASGLPMIVTDVGGNSEAIIDNYCGIVVPPKNIQKLAQAILFLYNNPEVAKQYGNKAKERVLNNFSINKCVDLYDQLYNNLLMSTGSSEALKLAEEQIHLNEI